MQFNVKALVILFAVGSVAARGIARAEMGVCDQLFRT